MSEYSLQQIDQIGSLVNLEELDVSENQLTHTGLIQQLKSLKN
ncbi:Leucine-rich_repeat domain superfamily [Hexamita inflata]|uniref:Leucine-rich repeat domain superfamily n=1 Tax=Hexamita inflata TaxID=28002 RepID=A0AA86PP66_9EUKA|nr:Leucine-rich repeat domain superfamily [Hexamita inflata]